MGKRKRKKSDSCYLCAKPDCDTREHIPPRGLFPKRPKGNLITVPAHGKCNWKFKADDERFRNAVIAPSWRTEEGRRAWMDQVVPSFKKNPGAQTYLRDRLLRVGVTDPVSGASGTLPGIFIEESLITRQVDRITRGLYYHRYSKPLPPDSPVEITKQGPPELWEREFERGVRERGSRLNWRVVEPRVFSYVSMVWDQDDRVFFAILKFFETEVFMARAGERWGS
jgi:hypothetical protein